MLFARNGPPLLRSIRDSLIRVVVEQSLTPGFVNLTLDSKPPAGTSRYCSFARSALASFRMGMLGSAFSGGKEVVIATAKLPFRHRLMMGCQPSLVGVVPFLPLLLSSAQHMRAPVVEENRRNSQAATGSSY
jgi:hypothetical protein